MRGWVLIATGLLAAGSTIAAEDRLQGYLQPGAIDLIKTLPPAPQKGEIRYETDRKVYRAMKRQIGGERWAYAIRDVPYDTPTMLRDFSCAANIVLTPTSAPATTRLLSRAAIDTGRANNAAKEYWKRLRPLWIDKGETCESKESLGKSYDYPSGHTTKGWTFGLVLAELLPDRATPLLARGRAYGESRIVCRVHNMSAVESGRMGATVTMESVRETPGYKTELAAARAELAALAASAPPPDAAVCAADARVLEPSVLAGLTKN